MALPTVTQQINNIVATTFDVKKKRVVVDGFFTDNPFFVRLNTKDKIKWRGGNQIRSTFIYDQLPGGSYGKGDTFNLQYTEFLTDLVLNWKRYHADAAIDGLDEAINRGEMALVDLVETMMEVQKRTLANYVGTDLYGDGTGNQGKALDGLGIAVGATGTYAGITRDTSKQGTAITSYANTTGGPFSLTMVNTAIGAIRFGNEKPDLILTTQTIWNRFWERSQTSERNVAEDLRAIGFDSVRFNGADVVVDPHCPSGYIWLLNTKYMEFWVLEGKDFYLRGPFEVHNEDARVWQCVTYCDLVCTGPRFQGFISSVS